MVGFELETFRSAVRRANHYATGAGVALRLGINALRVYYNLQRLVLLLRM